MIDFKNRKVFVAGAGGFIGGHLVNRLIDLGAKIVAVDIKPLEMWFQIFDEVENHSLDLKRMENCENILLDSDYVFNMACNMGGMGFIENNKAECMLSVLINTNLLICSKRINVKKFFFSSSACVYNADKQNNSFIDGLKEGDAYPALPEDGYGWEKLFSERMCRHFFEDFNLNIAIARYHNVYGPLGTYDGGREKAPAALCRKFLNIKKGLDKELEIWGDGEQTRSFLYIDDCIEGTLRLFSSEYVQPLNIGSEEQVSINQMADILQNISGLNNISRKYLLDMPKGVRGRSSNNEELQKQLNWNYSISLKEGLEYTYHWIEKDIKEDRDSRFTKKY